MFNPSIFIGFTMQIRYFLPSSRLNLIWFSSTISNCDLKFKTVEKGFDLDSAAAIHAAASAVKRPDVFWAEIDIDRDNEPDPPTFGEYLEKPAIFTM